MVKKPKRPRYPRSVKIGGITIKVRLDREMEDWGGYDHDERTIRLSPRCLWEKGELRETLRHELVHASLIIGGVDYMETYHSEPVVRCLDKIFFPMWDKLEQKYELY